MAQQEGIVHFYGLAGVEGLFAACDKYTGGIVYSYPADMGCRVWHGIVTGH